ncbi:hypothetical protein Tco_1147016 [Tanacetum coccineum]
MHFLNIRFNIKRCRRHLCMSEGRTVYLEELLSVINSDPNLPPSPVCEINVPEEIKSSYEDPPDLELKDLPSHLETVPPGEPVHFVPKKGGDNLGLTKPRLLRWIFAAPRNLMSLIRDKKGARKSSPQTTFPSLKNPIKSGGSWNQRCVFGKKLLTFLKLATVDPLGDTTVPITPLKRSSIQVSIGPRSTRMPMTMSRCDIYQRQGKISQRDEDAVKTSIQDVISRHVGIDLWGRPDISRGNKIDSRWQSNTYQKVKQKHSHQ